MKNAENSTQNVQKKQINNSVKIIVEHRFVGEKSLGEVMLPILYDEIIKQSKNRTFEKV